MQQQKWYASALLWLLITISITGCLPMPPSTPPATGSQPSIHQKQPLSVDLARAYTYVVTLLLHLSRHTTPAICARLHAAEANAILGEPAYRQPLIIPDFGLGQGCAYAPRSQPSPTGEAIMMGLVHPVVMLHQVSGAQVSNALPIVVGTLSEHPTMINPTVKARVDAASSRGEANVVLPLLDDLIVGADGWQVETLTTVSDATVFVWGKLNAQQQNEQPLAALLTLDRTGTLVVVTIFLPAQRNKDEVRQALLTLAEHITRTPLP